MSETTIMLPKGPAVPYLAEYLGFWHFEPSRFMRAAQLVRSMDIAGHLRDRAGRGGGAMDRRSEDAAKGGPEKSSALDAGGGAAKQDATVQHVRRGYSYEIVDGVAIVDVSGTLMKHVSSYDDSTSIVMLRNTVRKMRTDPLVRGAILVIDSPGGTVSGAYDLAEDVEQLAKAKPTYAYGQDCLCSAAYLQAAMTRGISVNSNCIAGSIGTYGVVYDYSKMFEQDGVKAIVISSGGVKGAGVPGTEITEEQVAKWQAEIDDLNGLFIAAVARGRKISTEKARSLADGMTYVGKAAKTAGIIDRVETLDQLFARVRQEVGGPGAAANGAVLQGIGTTTQDDRQDRFDRAIGGPVSADTPPAETPDDEEDPEDGVPAVTPGEKKEGEKKQESSGASAPSATETGSPEAIGHKDPEKGADMGQQSNPAGGTANEPKPATIKELREAFAGDSDFALQCADKALTLTEAKAEYADVLAKRNAELAARNKELEEKQAVKPAVGNKPVSDKPAAGREGTDGSAVDEFETKVNKLMDTRKLPRHEAAAKVLADDPDLRERYVAERNEERDARIEQRVRETMDRRSRR